MELGRKHSERLVTLDAMRGVAAYIVLVHHAYGPIVADNPLRAGYLAVDFFFILSGLVMSQAYEERFRLGLEFSRFALARLSRIAPTMWIGIALGALSFYSTFHDLAIVATLFFCAAVFMPLFATNVGIYPLDGVQWSLFFELAANAVHGALLWRLGTRPLTIAALLSLAVFAIASYRQGGVGVGDTANTFLIGFPRVGFAYTVGILLHRFRDRLRFPSMSPAIPALGLVLLVAAVSWDDRWATEMLAVVAMPILILAGSSARSTWDGFCDYLGRLSFPIYAIHVPILCFCAHLPRSYRLGVELILVTAVAAAIDRLLRRPAPQTRVPPIVHLMPTA